MTNMAGSVVAGRWAGMGLRADMMHMIPLPVTHILHQGHALLILSKQFY